jgi:hypothetical protein
MAKGINIQASDVWEQHIEGCRGTSTLARARDALKNSMSVLESDGLYIHKWDPAIRVVAAAHQTCPNASAEYNRSVCCYNYRDPPMLCIDIVAQCLLFLPHWTTDNISLSFGALNLAKL